MSRNTRPSRAGPSTICRDALSCCCGSSARSCASEPRNRLRESANRREIAPVIGVRLLRGLQHHRDLPKPRLAQPLTKSVRADRTAPDVLMPVYSRSELFLRIVHMHEADRADADRAFDGGHERAEAGGGPILVSGGQGMAGIETDAETIGADAVEHLGELLECRSQLAALA